LFKTSFFKMKSTNIVKASLKIFNKIVNFNKKYQYKIYKKINLILI